MSLLCFLVFLDTFLFPYSCCLSSWWLEMTSFNNQPYRHCRSLSLWEKQPMALWLIIMLAVSPPASLFVLISMHEDERGETCKPNLKNIFNGINSAVNYTDILMSYFASVCQAVNSFLIEIISHYLASKMYRSALYRILNSSNSQCNDEK